MASSIIGADRFMSAINAKANLAPRKAMQIVQSETAAMQSQAQRLEPVKTGHLKRSTNISVTKQGSQVIGKVSANAYNRSYNYGYAQENGTRYISGKHFMQTAFNARKASFENRIKGAMQ